MSTPPEASLRLSLLASGLPAEAAASPAFRAQQCASQRQVARIPRQACAHPVRDIRVTDAGYWVGIAERSACSGRTEGGRFSEGPCRAGLHEAQRELYLAT